MSTLETPGLKAHPTRILVYAPTWVGDIVMATPAFRAIRARFPNEHITVAVTRNARPVLEDAPWFDAFLETGPEDKGFLGTLRAAKRVRSGGYDVGILLTNSFRTALLLRLGRVKNRVGYARDFRRALLTESLKPKTENGHYLPAPMVDYYLALAAYLGCEATDRQLELFARPELERDLDTYGVRRGIDFTKRIVLMNPGAAFGASKRWPPEHFARAAETLAAGRDVQVVITCAPNERDLARSIALESHAPVVSLHDEPAGLSLLKPLVRRAAVMITNDTGPRHYAAALDTPVVTLFGPTDPRWSDTGFAKEIALSASAECAPCQRPTCRADHRCMRRITPESVVAAARELMEKFPKT